MTSDIVSRSFVCVFIALRAHFFYSRGGFREDSGGSVEPPFDPKFHFHGKVWITLVSLEYRIYHKYSHPLLFILYFSSTSPFYNLRMSVKKVGWMANSVDPDQTSRTVCLGLSVYLSEYIKYRNLFKSTPSEIILDPPLYSLSTLFVIHPAFLISTQINW